MREDNVFFSVNDVKHWRHIFSFWSMTSNWGKHRMFFYGVKEIHLIWQIKNICVAEDLVEFRMQLKNFIIVSKYSRCRCTFFAKNKCTNLFFIFFIIAKKHQLSILNECSKLLFFISFYNSSKKNHYNDQWWIVWYNWN